MAASDQMCRVSIRTADKEADLTLPAQIPIDELMPAVIDLVGTEHFSGRDPRLTRVCGQQLDRAATLAECTVTDGELLILSTEQRPAPTVRFDPSTVVEDATAVVPQSLWRPTAWWVLGWATMVLLVILGRPILVADANRYPEIGALSTLLLLAGTVAMHRKQVPRAAAVSLGVAAVAFAGVTAALAQPGPPGMPTFLLATATIASMSLLVWRLLGCAPSLFLPIAATAMAISIATAGAVLTWWPTVIVGPILTAASLAVPAVSARLAAHSSGLTTVELPDRQLEARARVAHHHLTVIVVSAASTAAVGALLTAATTANPLPAATFIAIAAAVLLSRTPHHNDSHRVAAQMMSSLITLTALTGLCVATSPPSTPWLCGALLLVTTGAAWAAQREWGRRPNRAVRRAISTVELLLDAAVAPAACAAAGAFTGLANIGLPW